MRIQLELCLAREYLTLTKLYLNRLSVRTLSEGGISLIEVLVALLLIGLISLGIAANAIGSFHILKKTEENYAASNLALSKIEQLSAIPVNELSADDNSVEDSVTVSGMNTIFKRTTTVAVNADSSRTITVKVESLSAKLPTAVTFTTTFSMWQ